MPQGEFSGDEKVDQSRLIRLENRVVAKTIHYVPGWLETYHLTLMTIVWCNWTKRETQATTLLSWSKKNA